MTIGVRLSTCILPIYRWKQGREVWQQAEALGFHTAYTYDHLSWREPFRDGPWFGAVPTLTAAASATRHLRLGTLVSTPNYREPVAFAKELITVDDVSTGRLTLGLGAGTSGFDAAVLGNEPWSPRERADRLAGFVGLLDRLLTEPVLSASVGHYRAHDARTIPGCVQTPRIPFAIAAGGRRGMRLAARFGQAWVTTGDPSIAKDGDPTQSRKGVAKQIRRFEDVCTEQGRDPADVDRILLTGFTPDDFHGSVEAFEEAAWAYQQAGISEIVLHWPIAGTVFDADMRVFERIAERFCSPVHEGRTGE